MPLQPNSPGSTPTTAPPTNGDTVLYSIVIEDLRNEGVIPLPVYTSDPTKPTACKIVRLHAAIETVMIRWEARRDGGAPQVPHYKSLDPNLVFLRGGVGRTTPVPDALGTSKVWSLAGWGEYAKITPQGLDADMVGSKFPWDTADVSTNTIPGTIFRQDLIGVPQTLTLPTAISGS